MAAAAWRALEARCARCHQADPHSGLPPSGGLGNILAFEELARDAHLIRPGSPDTSRLFERAIDPRHGEGSLRGNGRGSRPSAAEIEALYTWIEQLAPPQGSCGSGPPHPAPTDHVLLASLEAAGKAQARTTRFVTLAPLLADCAGRTNLPLYGEALGTLLSSLSWQKTPVSIRPVPGAEGVYAVTLDALGWSPEQWDRLAAAQPAGLLKASPELAAATGTAHPLVRGDWLAAAAMQPPLYYELLGIPEKFPELEAKLQLSCAAEGATGNGKTEIAKSAVTGARRTIRRCTAAAGPAWSVTDYNGTSQEPGKPAGTRLIFMLPDGFPAFAVFAPDGRRRSRAALEVDKLLIRDFGPTFAGRTCMACHRSGPLAPFEAATSVPPGSTVPAAPVIQGLDPVAALAREYRKDVNALRLAAEAGMNTAAFWQRVDDLSTPGSSLDQPHGATLIRRLAQRGVLPRWAANTLISALNIREKGNSAPAPGSVTAPDFLMSTDGIGLGIETDKAVYKVGDRPRFTLRTNATCHLTFINIDQKGKARVLFPNDFDRDTLMLAGTALQIPPPSAPYDLRFTETGRETFVAVCTPGAGNPAGIEHRFALRRFTSLGDWRKFVAATAGEAEKRRILRAHRRRARRSRQAAETGQGALPPSGRDAITVEIRG